MSERWRMLLVLFLARTAMAFQFQAVGALSLQMRASYGLGLADIGYLIGLYFAPGLLLALPGGALGRRFGDKRMVLVGLGLMVLGSAAILSGIGWYGDIVGRLLAGVGGILLNVLMSKMVADWFSGREISLAMSIFTNSWPLGIAAALIVLPPLAIAQGLMAGFALVGALTVLGFCCVALFYRAPAIDLRGPSESARLRGAALYAVCTAGALWGIYNAALSMTFSFGAEVFADKGWALAEAGAVASIVLWLLAIGSPIGGALADWSKRPGAILISGNLAFAAALYLAAAGDGALWMIVLVGAVSGLAVGPMMSLPARVLSPDQRAIGMGVFFTLHYAFALTGPTIGGWVADLTGDVTDTFRFGSALLVISAGLLMPYRAFARAVPKVVS